METFLLNDILVIILLSVVVIYLCHRLRLPIIVGFLLTGVLAGPHGFALVHEVAAVNTLAETGVILLMFTIGLEFSFRSLLRIRKPVLLGGSLQIGMTVLAAFGAARLFGFGSGEAVLAGFLVSLSSTAIVMKILQDRAEMETPQGNASLGILIFQDIAVVPMMLLIPFLAGTRQTEWVPLAILGGKIVGIGLLVPFLSRWFVPRVFFGIAKTRSRELFLITTLAICLAVAWLTHAAGLSLALGSFLAGLIISDSEYSHQALGEILPFKDVFTSFFFVSIGMLLDIGFFMQHPHVLLLTAFGVLVGKSLIAGAAALFSGLSLRPAVIAGITLCQVGEFSFILAQTGISHSLVSAGVYQTFLSVSVLTMIATPFLIAAATSIAEQVNRLPFPRKLKREKTVPQGKIPRENHIIIVGFGLNGRNLAQAARNAGIPYAIIEMNPASVRHERARGEPIAFGDATKPAVLLHAGIREARTLVVVINDPAATRRITELARRLNPSLYILVRTRYIAEMTALIKLGANDVIPEEFETSVEIFSRVLAKYFIPKEEIEKMTGEIRSDGYEMFRSFSRSGQPVCTMESCLPDLEIASFRIGAGSPAVGKTLQETEMRKRHRVTLLAVNRNSRILSNPESDLTFTAGDILFVVGEVADIRQVRELFGPGNP